MQGGREGSVLFLNKATAYMLRVTNHVVIVLLTRHFTHFIVLIKYVIDTFLKHSRFTELISQVDI